MKQESIITRRHLALIITYTLRMRKQLGVVDDLYLLIYRFEHTRYRFRKKNLK